MTNTTAGELDGVRSNNNPSPSVAGLLSAAHKTGESAFLTLGLPWHAGTRPARINPSHQFFRELKGFIGSCLPLRRGLPVGRQSATQKNRSDNTQSSLPALIHFGKISYSLYLRLAALEA